MPIATDEMLQKIKDRQWALADIDWDAPGAELITDEQRPMLKDFMADVVWVEAMGACGFKALELKAEDPYLKEIYRYFQAEEQRHANAELALMHRWGMLEEGEFPEPNIQLRLIMQWLDKNVDKMSLGVLGTLIPMLEVALDGALLKFLLDEVKDPVCHETFNKINADESRHLTVDFHLLEVLGMPRTRQLVINTVATFLSPSVLMGLVQFAPLLS
ncbi:MAG: ferritin-like domain-containing protein, partial [Pseudonocardia sp.]